MMMMTLASVNQRRLKKELENIDINIVMRYHTVSKRTGSGTITYNSQMCALKNPINNPNFKLVEFNTFGDRLHTYDELHNYLVSSGRMTPSGAPRYDVFGDSETIKNRHIWVKIPDEHIDTKKYVYTVEGSVNSYICKIVRGTYNGMYQNFTPTALKSEGTWLVIMRYYAYGQLSDFDTKVVPETISVRLIRN